MGYGELKFQRLHTGEHMMCSGWGNRLFCRDRFAYEIAQYFCCFSRDRVSPLTHCEARSASVLLPQPPKSYNLQVRASVPCQGCLRIASGTRHLAAFSDQAWHFIHMSLFSFTLGIFLFVSS